MKRNSKTVETFTFDSDKEFTDFIAKVKVDKNTRLFADGYLRTVSITKTSTTKR